MQSRNILEMNENGIKLKEEGRFTYNFLCHLLLPLIDSYWIAYTYFNVTKEHQHLEFNELVEKMQWTGENLFDMSYFKSQESSANYSLKKAIIMFVEQGILTKKVELNTKRVEKEYISVSDEY